MFHDAGDQFQGVGQHDRIVDDPAGHIVHIVAAIGFDRLAVLFPPAGRDIDVAGGQGVA